MCLLSLTKLLSFGHGVVAVVDGGVGESFLEGNEVAKDLTMMKTRLMLANNLADEIEGRLFCVNM